MQNKILLHVANGLIFQSSELKQLLKYLHYGLASFVIVMVETKSNKILTLWSRECVRKSSVLHSTSETLWLWLLKLVNPFPAQWLERSSLFDLDSESPEEKLEQRFLIFRHLRASVPLPLANKGVGAMLILPVIDVHKQLGLEVKHIYDIEIHDYLQNLS